MAAARCSICALNFPVNIAGRRCPVCDYDTLAALTNAVPDDPEELHQKVSLAEFERAYGPAEVE